ncbi:hypothetical protein [Paenibacillus glycanilyticus]|uniref:hypothetical protein n=1 Tax=Paenibacillus glycanilyticus TaxID=126569 RepID=UPI003EB7B65A
MHPTARHLFFVLLVFPPQHQNRHPGFEYPMIPRPLSDNPYYKGSGKPVNPLCIYGRRGNNIRYRRSLKTSGAAV